MNIQPLLTGVLLLLGAGFLVANARLIIEYVQYVRRRRGALLVWPGPFPPNYGLGLAVGVLLGVLVLIKLFVVRRPVFGEAMMFLYFAYLVPLRQRINRGFYADGIWADSTFIPYNEVGGISWREGEHDASLIVISRLKNLARRLVVPMEHYSEARRLLREKIGVHEIQFAGTGLDLGARDERDDI
jgi:hypothetical protein